MEARERGTQQAEVIELDDKDLDKVAGGSLGDGTCPDCGSPIEYVGAHVWACANPKCGWMI